MDRIVIQIGQGCPSKDISTNIINFILESVKQMSIFFMKNIVIKVASSQAMCIYVQEYALPQPSIQLVELTCDLPYIRADTRPSLHLELAHDLPYI